MLTPATSVAAAPMPAPAPARLAVKTAAPSAATVVATGLADPAARRWVVLGVIGIVTSLLLTVAVALLSSRGVASADVPVAEAARPNRTTLVREIGGAPRSPTPGTGTTATAPAAGAAGADGASQSLASAALRQLRRVGRAIVTVDGVRRLALGGSVPFAENGPATASLLPDDGEQVALADTDGAAGADADGDVRLGEGAVFMRLAESGSNDGARVSALGGQPGVTVLASPVAAAPTSAPTSTPTPKPGNVTTPTSVPPTPTSVPATATSVPATATSVPPTAVPPTATSAPVFVTATPVIVVVVTATPLPATQTPVVVTATPEPTQRATRTPVVVTATPNGIFPNSSIPNSTIPYAPQATIPWLPSAPTAAPTSAPFAILPLPTAAPTNTPIPTATMYVVPDPRNAPVAAAPAAPVTASAPRRSEPAAPAAPAVPAAPAGQAPILAEGGTRTPFNPAPRTAAARPAQGAEGQPAQAGQAPNAAPAQSTEASRDAAILDKLAGRALLAVNAARAQAGALPLTRNPAMDTASALHAQYDVATGQADGNFQTRGTPLFMGETPSARVARAGGSRSPVGDRVAEVMALGEVEPERAVQGWLDSVFHRAVVLDLAAQFVGFGQQTAGTATSSVMDLGGKREVANASGWFPASGATEVPTRCTCDDYAEATGKSGPFGYPATLLLGQVRPQGMPALARMSEVDENGPGVAMDLVDAYGNPTLLPQQPLKPGTRYVVRMAWTNGPTVSWGFTTAAQ